jgi:hypothetical protein
LDTPSQSLEYHRNYFNYRNLLGKATAFKELNNNKCARCGKSLHELAEFYKTNEENIIKMLHLALRDRKLLEKKLKKRGKQVKGRGHTRLLYGANPWLYFDSIIADGYEGLREFLCANCSEIETNERGEKSNKTSD